MTLDPTLLWLRRISLRVINHTYRKHASSKIKIDNVPSYRPLLQLDILPSLWSVAPFENLQLFRVEAKFLGNRVKQFGQ